MARFFLPSVASPIRRRTVLRALGAAVWLGGAPLALRAQPELARVRVAMGREESLCHLPLVVAQQLGYFRSEGLDVRLVELADGEHALGAVKSAQVEAVSGSYLTVLHQQLRGQALQLIVLQGRAPQVSLGVSLRQLPGYRELPDLRGKRIGMSSTGAMSDVLARVMLSKAAIRPADVHWVALGSVRRAVLALRSGEVDALSHVDPGMTQLEQKGELRTIADPRTLKGSQEVFGGPLPGTCLFAPQGFVARHPHTCQALVNGIARGLKWLQTAQPQDIIMTVPETHMMGDRALYLASFYRLRESYSPDGLLGEEAVQTAWSVASRLGDVREADAQAVLERSYTNEFAQKARLKLSKA
jgi:NitT/TauT family transport system substrate-binding protein